MAHDIMTNGAEATNCSTKLNNVAINA